MANIHRSLDLRSLRHMVALSRRLSYARAADDLGISQSTLSRSIQSLEAQLGMRLFNRDRAGVSLTPQASELVDRSAAIVADFDDLERQFLLSAQGLEGRVRIGMAPMPARALLPAVMSERLTVAPKVKNEVVVQDVDALWKLLVAGEIEFFVCSERLIPDFPTAQIEPLGTFPINMIVRAGHPLLTSEMHNGEFPLLRSSWSGYTIPPEIGRIIGNNVNIIEDFGSLAAITASSDAIWISSLFAVIDELKSGILCELPWIVAGSETAAKMVICSHERRSASPHALILKQLLKQKVRALGNIAKADPK